ncbi:sigma-70 family RNA polymerase sigma factor [Tissierella sp. MSJ-40]|uniref:Sigma-70 family RNA polymerase sigma factor n=1 Tax=Tissierella simiarum TaxID=2841534 RepID=A0ABS6EAN8_9FIRM|nr:sigma-70 family RNA polymerase sigma factor [Tissierella simiarum]MBU5439480.1 sigma-70 family RNA polymerase sigma factor [Tissierella simiarum]
MLDEKINKMIEENLKLVPFVVHSKFKVDVSKNPDLLDEYISIGNIGLIKACEGFDENFGGAFSTYAVPIIWGEIQRFRRDVKNSVRLPRRLHKAGIEYGRGINENKDIDTICKESGIKKEDIEEWLATKDIVNLDTPVRDPKNEGSNLTRLDMLTDNFNIEEFVIEDMKYKEKMEILEKVLSDIEFKIVKLIESGVYRQKDIAKEIGVSQAQISRILKKMTEIVGPVIEEYYSGKISWNELCSKLSIKEKVSSSAFFDSICIALRNKFKSADIEVTKATIIEKLRELGINENSLTENQIDKLLNELEVFNVKKFEKEINELCKWLMDNPGEELNMGEELKKLGMSRSSISYYRGTIKDKILERLKDQGLDIREVPYGAKGTRLVLYSKEQPIISGEELTIPVEEIKPLENNILLDIADIPLKDYNLEFAEALQKSLSMLTRFGKRAVLDIKVREVS